jgi:MYXO-CTERM domain-containing protein
MRSWALERLVCACSHSPSPDLRWMLAAFALHALAAVEAFIQRQLVRLARNTMGRALEGARFAGSLSAADSMVAAGGR